MLQEELQTPPRAPLMPTSQLGLLVPARYQGLLLDQNLPQLLDLLGEPLDQREVRRVGQLPLKILQVTQTKTARPKRSDGFDQNTRPE